MYEVKKCSMGGTRLVVMTGTEQECIDFCNAYNWKLDEGYVWDLEVQEA